MRTAPARARWSRSWAGSISRTAARSSWTVSPSPSTGRPRPGRWASPSSTRSRASSRICRSPENVFLGHAPVGRLGGIDWAGMRRAAHKVFQELGVRMDVGAPVRGLSMADQQLIEIAKALSLEARVLILDEPTAAAVGPRGRPTVHDRAPAARPRRRHPVRQSSARRSLRAVRSRDGLPGRPTHHHGADHRADDGRSRATHGRPRGVVVPQGRVVARRHPAGGPRPRPGQGVSRRVVRRPVRARSSGSPASSGRAAPRLPGSCSGSTSRTRARSAWTATRSTSEAPRMRSTRGSPISRRIVTATVWSSTSRSPRTSACRSCRGSSQDS